MDNIIKGECKMAKKKYQVYLEEEETEFVKEFLNASKIKGGLSGYLNGYLETTAKTLRAAGWKAGNELTYAKAFKIGLKGIMQDPA
jgi:hypothetical protein